MSSVAFHRAVCSMEQPCHRSSLSSQAGLSSSAVSNVLYGVPQGSVLHAEALSWIQSVITGRTQFVRCLECPLWRSTGQCAPRSSPVIDPVCHHRQDSVRSAVSNVLCGVPKGSVLGPVLFLLLLLVCVSFTIIGEPRNSVLIRRV